MSTTASNVTPSSNTPSVQHVVGTRKNILGLRRVLDNLGLEIGKATAQAICLDGSGYVPADLRRDTSLKYTSKMSTPVISATAVTPVIPVRTHLVGTRKNILGLRKVLDNAGYGTDAHTIALYLDENGIVPADLRRRQDLLIQYRTCAKWLRVSDVPKFKQVKSTC
jgi:hypothetical protein